MNQSDEEETEQTEKNILLEPVLTTALSRGDVISPGQDIFN